MSINETNKNTSIKKFDFTKIVADLQEKYKKDDRLCNKFSLGSDLKVLEEKDYIKLGEWWTKSTGLFGVPLNRLTLIAGDEDSGKTSFCIQAIKAAQEQGVGVLLCDTEGKTTKKDFECWGVDPDQIMTIQSRIAEEAFKATAEAIEGFTKDYPDTPLLVIIDSLGNVLSQRDAEMDLVEDSSAPGGHGRSNRQGLNRLIAMNSVNNKIALVLISYTYDNIGSVGKTTAGGKALRLFASLHYQTSRKGWYDRTEKGVKIRAGADVVWKMQKNHINKEAPGAKEIVFRITKDGMNLVEAKVD